MSNLSDLFCYLVKMFDCILNSECPKKNILHPFGKACALTDRKIEGSDPFPILQDTKVAGRTKLQIICELVALQRRIEIARQDVIYYLHVVQGLHAPPSPEASFLEVLGCNEAKLMRDIQKNCACLPRYITE